MKTLAIFIFGLSLLLSACSSGGSPNPNPNPNPIPDETSFSVKGTWVGTLTLGDGSTRTLIFVFDNNGIGDDGLVGSMTIEGLPKMSFENAYINSGPEAKRTAILNITDSDGYLYNFDGSFTEKRVDDGYLKVANPALIINNESIFNPIVLVKQ